MRKSLFVVLVCAGIFSFGASAQTGVLNNDSLRKALTKSTTDTDRIRNLGWLTTSYSEYKPDSTLYYEKELMALAKKNHLDDVIAYSFRTAAYAQRYKDNYAEALKLELQAGRIIEKSTDTGALANHYNMMAVIYKTMENYPKALYYERLCKKTALSCKDMEDLVYSYMNLGAIFEKTNVLDSAIYYEIAAIKQDRKHIKESYANFENSILGNVYFKKGYYSLALKYYWLSRKQCIIKKDLSTESETCYGLATLYQKIARPDSALYYAKTALSLAGVSGARKSYYLAAGLLSATYDKQHAIDSAFKYLKISTGAKDSIYSAAKFREIANMTTDEFLRQNEIEAGEEKYRSQIKIYALLGVGVVFLVVMLILWRHNTAKQKAYRLLQAQKNETDIQKENAEAAIKELKTAQTQLIQSEKMASLGELTAGIAHEIQNPLNFVNNFSEVNVELIDELHEEIDKGDYDEVKAIAADIKENQQKIIQHGKRADGIVKGMLQHSRASSTAKEPTDLNTLADEYLRLSYHGLRAKDKTFNAELVTHFQGDLPKMDVVQQDVGRVLLNLFNNAFYSVQQKQKITGADYKPTVEVTTITVNSAIQIKVRDNGIGISDDIKDKILQPFFTTKPTGEGTGLGLSLSYDIVVKGHGGKIEISSKPGEYAEFVISLLK